MKGDTTQPTRISADEYERFKQFVEDVHGSTRGHLKTEIENALREYRQPDNSAEPIQRIEDDIATIKAQLAETEADGGRAVVGSAAPPSGADTHTDEKPSPKAPRAEKVAWIAAEEFDPSGGSAPVVKIKEHVADAFGFGDRTAEKYVQPVIDELGAKRHPENDDILVWGDMVEQVREKLAAAEGGE